LTFVPIAIRFYTGESAKLLDVEGQVDRFYKKLSARQTYVEQQKAKEESLNSWIAPLTTLPLLPAPQDSQEGWCLTIGQVMEKLAEGDAALLADCRLRSVCADFDQEEAARAGI
jgi:large subunit ribosomal protein L31